MDSGWIEIDHSPIAAPDEPLLVWHVYSGVMVERMEQAMKNRFITHWRKIDDDAWIDARMRKPTKADADPYDCVISQNMWGEILTAGWHRFANEASLIRWQSPPGPPSNFRELRKTSR